MTLVIVPGGQQPIVIDLDEKGWLTTYAHLMRDTEATWHLFRKDGGPVFSMVVWKNDRPYYAARHIGIASGSEQREVIAYGIGKQLPDGHANRLWILPNGQICGGDDVEPLARSLL